MVCASGHRLPFRDNSFELISAFTVFSSIRDSALTRAVADDMRRVLRPGGRIVCYDMRLPNPNNKSIRAITLRQLRRMFPGADIRSRTLTVLPPLSRKIASSERTYRILANLKLFNAHRLTLITPADR